MGLHSVDALRNSVGSFAACANGRLHGHLNFFIVIPEIVASLTFQPLVRHVFDNNPLYVVMLGALACL